MSPESPKNLNRSNPDSPSVLRRRDQLSLAVILCVIFVLGFIINADEGSKVEHSAAPEKSLKFTLDLNTASFEELTLLPGIGETLARRIVEHREAHGPFTSSNELTKVRGIGPKKLEAIQPFFEE